MNVNPSRVVELGIIQAEVDEEQIQMVGIDMRVRAIFAIMSDGEKLKLPAKLYDGVLLMKGNAYEVVLDRVKMPDNMFGYIIGRSSFNRKGVLMRSSVIDPGYIGDVGVTAYCFAPGVKIKLGDRVGQLLVFPANSAGSYKGQYQGEKRT